MTDLHVLIVDDDPNAARFASHVLAQRFPRMDIEIRCRVDVDGQFDVYIIDNDFEGKKIAAELAGRIRLLNPRALVIAFSSTLDAETLKGLIRCGCDGVWDKSDPEDIARVVQVVSEYADVRREVTIRPRSGLVRAMESMTALLREWNLRLDQLQHN